MFVKIIEDSISNAGIRLTTMQLQYQRFIHAEFMTHRMFSRNASSSRAIPVSKMIEQVRNNPAMPVHWGKNQAGMQANQELNDSELQHAKSAWIEAANKAANIAEYMNNIGLHKQVANRILEPFQFINVIVTATEWDNFFDLRMHKDAQPEFRALAHEMYRQRHLSIPVLVPNDEWHLPYVNQDERKVYPLDILIKLSAARCARVSYLKHDNSKPNIEDDVALYNKLITSKPEHASPIEHQARPFKAPYMKSGNFLGWEQFRSIHESFNK